MTETKTVPIIPPSSSVIVVVKLIGYGVDDDSDTIEVVLAGVTVLF